MRQGSQQGGFACIGKPVKIIQAYQTCKKCLMCVSEIHRKTITQGGSQRMTHSSCMTYITIRKYLHTKYS